MKPTEFMKECTTSGAVATVAQPIGKTISRSGAKGGNLFKGKKTSKPFYEDEINEEDRILSPEKGNKIKSGLLSKPESSANPTDSVKIDIPLLIRLLEYAREDANSDLDLHDLAEKLVDRGSRGKTLTMKDYEFVVDECAGVIAGGGVGESEELDEVNPNTIIDRLKQGLEKAKQQVKQGDLVGAAKIGKKIASIKSRLDRKVAANKEPQVNEAANHFMGKYSKDGVTYQLWNDGNYLYNLTRVIDGVPKHVKHWPNHSHEEVQSDLAQRGYQPVSLNENHDSGISAEDLANSIFYRLERMYPDIVTKYGHEVVGDAVLNVAEFHSGAEEIGSSDISIMVKEVLRELGRKANLDEYAPADGRGMQTGQRWTEPRHVPDQHELSERMVLGSSKISSKMQTESSERADNVVGSLNAWGYYTDDCKIYVNDKTGDKFIRFGSSWKHDSGKVGNGPEELDNFIYSLRQGVKENWQKVNKSDKTDGMSKKAVKAYRREHPGSKLQTAVTKKPSKLKAGSKDAKRRKSFCARMSGMKGPMKDEHGKPTAKAKALSRWNCEESVEESLRTENPCWKGYKPVGTKKKDGKTVPNCVQVKESAILKGLKKD